MPREAGLKPSLEKPLGYLFPSLFLPGYHLHHGERKRNRASSGLLLGKRLDGNSCAVGKGIGNYLKFLSINAYPFGLCITHTLELITDFMRFDRLLAGRQKISSHSI